MCQNLNITDVCWTNQVNMRQRQRSVGRWQVEVTDAIRSLVNGSSLQPECARVLHESLFVSTFMYSSETFIW